MAASWQAWANSVETKVRHCTRCKKELAPCAKCAEPLTGGTVIWCSKSPSGSRHYCKLCTEKLG